MDAISRKPQISFPITKNRNLQENISVLDSKPLCSQGHNSSSIYDGFNVLHSTSRWAFHLESIWLFTLSDLKTIVGPETSFGLISAISAQAFGLTPSSAPPYGFILRRAWIVAFWTWINLLPFAIDNQRQPASIQEDMVNKPWRPMPSRRLTPKTAKTLMLGLYPIAVAVSFAFGGLTQCVALVLLGFWYNDYGGADVSWITRNFINACGFLCYSSGAMEVAMGATPRMADMPRLLPWFLIVWAVVFSTVQTQDICDQAGDALRSRKTLPLVLGDSLSRWITSGLIAFWSWACPWYWGPPFPAYFICMAVGFIIIFRTLTKRSVEDDKATFKLWNLWILILYVLPLVEYLAME